MSLNMRASNCYNIPVTLSFYNISIKQFECLDSVTSDLQDKLTSVVAPAHKAHTDVSISLGEGGSAMSHKLHSNSTLASNLATKQNPFVHFLW